MDYKIGDEIMIKMKSVNVSDYEVTTETKNGKRLYFSHDTIEDNAELASKTYEQGLTDAWELAKKIVGMGNDKREDVFGYPTVPRVMETHTAEEALAKIEAYKKEREIKLGDEVVHDADGYKTTFFVTYLTERTIKGIEKNGDTHYFTFPNQYIKKTGKHIDIEGLLKQIGE